MSTDVKVGRVSYWRGQLQSWSDGTRVGIILAHVLSL